MKFYICKHCKNIIYYMNDKGAPVSCCGEKMTELIPATSDGAYEKHIPVIKNVGNNVTIEVGEVLHPMLDVHYIEWIVLETKKRVYIERLNPGDAPKAVFTIEPEDEIVAAYEYCNLHGLYEKR